MRMMIIAAAAAVDAQTGQAINGILINHQHYHQQATTVATAADANKRKG